MAPRDRASSTSDLSGQGVLDTYQNRVGAAQFILLQVVGARALLAHVSAKTKTAHVQTVKRTFFFTYIV